MKPLPSDPMRQHRRFITAFCDDLWDMCLNGGNGTPRADAVCEITRQMAPHPIPAFRKEGEQ